ncbi:uncharacterized protein RCC_09493 [Ramularia collo-cygni]|uniref:Uncharacterized protein n=1 Tax=Ramularia collo-cygni TaxID=112498 RepID=A0A2D3VK78_9PEZI|nr:uncharacterized protein RCC_09493 [Ramularia collo-cygni]CZT23779.1 uncharacterized protein RCC_09493 [Ramularia collo-cygni]
MTDLKLCTKIGESYAFDQWGNDFHEDGLPTPHLLEQWSERSKQNAGMRLEEMPSFKLWKSAKTSHAESSGGGSHFYEYTPSLDERQMNEAVREYGEELEMTTSEGRWSRCWNEHAGRVSEAA